ncbi:hypothetical protein L6172_11905 [Thalassospiraceae bacterium SW-3-3]|nr:hypothetical protein L6172_11905 [Thalassospiraceae bacterium SW-3-3]
MKNIKQWVGIALVSIALVAAACTLLLFIDSTCSPLTSEACRLWIGFQWETVLAGALGLTGGIFVITSSREQIRAMQEETEKTLSQAKLHRADEISAALYLARDAAADIHTWANGKVDFFEGLRAQVNSGTLRTNALESAVNLAFSELKERCIHIGKIVDAHQMNSFNYNVTASLKKLEDTFRIANKPEETPENIKINHHILVDWDRITHSRPAATAAITEIDRQITHIRERCSIID